MKLVDISGTKTGNSFMVKLKDLGGKNNQQNQRLVQGHTHKKCYQPRTNSEKGMKRGLLVDFHVILTRWKNDF